MRERGEKTLKIDFRARIIILTKFILLYWEKNNKNISTNLRLNWNISIISIHHKNIVCFGFEVSIIKAASVK